MVQNMSCKIYMDHAATTEMLPQVRKAMEPYLMEEYGNASTSYEMGRRTREALEVAREQIAMLIRAKPEEIFFTSGGSESDNWVIKNVAAEKKAVSYTHLESAQLDGAGYTTIFLKIYSPLCKPVYATVALFVAVGQWNSWFDAMLYNRMNGKLTTLQYALMKLLSSCLLYTSRCV